MICVVGVNTHPNTKIKWLWKYSLHVDMSQNYNLSTIDFFDYRSTIAGLFKNNSKNKKRKNYEIMKTKK